MQAVKRTRYPTAVKTVWLLKSIPMERTAADIFRDALALPAEARAELARRLRESLDSGVEVHRKQFEQARRRAVNRLCTGLDLQWTPAPSRDELHDR